MLFTYRTTTNGIKDGQVFRSNIDSVTENCISELIHY